ncbi:hypothetical protein BT96DRAFT_961824 [Gymnopus androsaceus JB14]|uniref:RNase III domain-containing protein n=1 Tax=Gymnopus androsaceus JB14 TaxID=1447944 RepID=A0A6A4ILG4_9AGAR|nr:hypothetical protein BT96DRAFT_961824 [Gymnopus androsaceus JB14]
MSYDTNSDIKKGKKKVLFIDSSLKQVGSLVLADLPFHGDDSSSISHPVFRIIKNFYTDLDPSSRPLILAGLFASTSFYPDITFRSLILEAALHSKIYGLSAEQRAACFSTPYPVKETIVCYDPPNPSPSTQLVQKLRALNSTESSVRRVFDIYQYTLAELGACASDLVWRRGSEYLGSLPSSFHQILRESEFTLPNLDMSSPDFNVTPKLLKLVQILKSCQEFGDDFRGVIFVRRRILAQMIERLFALLNAHLRFIRTRVILGSLDVEMSPQDDILRQFESGSWNLLIVTKYAEDFEIPKASVVIQFDLCDSQISYAHLLSHCRAGDGHVISMVERDNSAHFNIVSRIIQVQPPIRGWMNALCWTSQGTVARELPYESRNPYVTDSEEEEAADALFIMDPTTGSKMYPRDAVNVMYLIPFKGSVLPDEKSVYKPLFEFDVQDDGRFVCRVQSDGSSQTVTPAWSAPSLTKAGARRLASYDFCVALYEKGLLDSHLFPKPRMLSFGSATLPPIDNKLSGTRAYDRKSPSFWSNNVSTSVSPLTRLYPIVISVESGTKSIPPHGPLLLLTRQPLPMFPSFRVFFAGLPSRVSLTRAEPFVVDEHQLQDIHMYTNQVLRGILNKPHSAPLDEVLVFYAPLDNLWSLKAEWISSLPNVQSHISWSLIASLVNGWIVPLKYDSVEALTKDTEDALIQDRWSQFTRRYDVVKIRSDLNPLNKPLDPELMDYENLVEVCKAHRKGFEGLKDYKQPLLEVSGFPSVIDRLNPAAGPFKPSTSTHKYFIPELCAKVTIPASIFRTALLLPCIMRRLDDFLLVKELNAGLFNHCVSDELLHATLSASSAGIEYDYERLEMLGDAYLKYLSSIYVFVVHPKADEGSMHNYRQSIISNKSLLKNAVAVGLPAFIQARPLNSLEKTLFKSKLATSDDEETHHKSYMTGTSRHKRKKHHSLQRFGDKAIADVAEAIMGAALLSGGTDAALKVTKALKVPLPEIEEWSDFSRKAHAPLAPVSSQIKGSTIKAVEAIIGSHFKQPELLIHVLSRTSKTGAESTYERLEFIGDAILDFMVVQHVFHRNKRMSPGGLTLLKGAMVSNAALAAVCVWSGLHQHLVFESASLAHDVREYASLLQRNQVQEFALAEKEGRLIGQYWHNIETPKVLSDIVESLLGAIYVSDDYSPAGAEAFFEKVFKPFYRHITLQTISHHPTKVLFELFQAQGCQDFQVVKEHNEYLVLVHDVVLSSSQDEPGMSGAKVASCFGLDALEGDPSFLTRTCDCWKKTKT